MKPVFFHSLNNALRFSANAGASDPGIQEERLMIDTRDSRLYRMGYGDFMFWSQRHREERLWWLRMTF
jgi:hypothetical protein